MRIGAEGVIPALWIFKGIVYAIYIPLFQTHGNKWMTEYQPGVAVGIVWAIYCAALLVHAVLYARSVYNAGKANSGGYFEKNLSVLDVINKK